jgi:hypothetical protein
MSMQAGLDNIMAVMVALGIENVPGDPPENISSFPIAVVYSTTGTTTDAPSGAMTMLDSVTIAVLVARGLLPAAAQATLPYRETVPAAIFNALHAGELAPIINLGPITHTLGPVQWGEATKTFGYLFTLTGVKTQQAL